MTRRRKRWRFGVAALAVVAAVPAVPRPAAADPRAEQLYQSGLAKYGAGDYQGAVRDAEAATAADPKHWQAWQLDGNARYALGDKDGALTVYRYALRINPDNPQLKGFVDHLAAAAQPAAAAGGGAGETYQGAVQKYSAGDLDGATQGAAAAVRADPNHWEAWQLLGNCRYARGDKRGALEAYNRSLGAHPDNPQVRAFTDQLRAEVVTQPGSSAGGIRAIADPSAAPPAPTGDAGVLPGGRRRGVFFGAAGRTHSAFPGEAADAAKVMQEAALSSYGAPPRTAIAGPGSMVGGGVEVILLRGAVGVLARGGYEPAKSLVVTTTGADGSGNSYTETSTYPMSLLDFVVGALYEPLRLGAVFARVSASAGVAYTSINYRRTSTKTYPSGGGSTAAFASPVESYAFALGSGLELGADIGRVEAFAQAGYLLSSFASTSRTKPVDVDHDGTVDFPRGSYLGDLNGRPVPFDLSGMQLVVGVRYRK